MGFGGMVLILYTVMTGVWQDGILLYTDMTGVRQDGNLYMIGVWRDGNAIGCKDTTEVLQDGNSTVYRPISPVGCLQTGLGLAGW